MSYIVDRLILIVFSILMLTQAGSITEAVVIGLIAVFISGVCYYVNNKITSIVLSCIYIVFLFFFPMLAFIAPIIIYELFEEKIYWGIGALLIVEVIDFVVAEPMPIVTILLLIFMEILAGVLCYKTMKNEVLHTENIHIRDDSEERNLLLAEKNKHLIEKQDSEIYVATLKERNRIAREIHDNVGHMLTRSILQMGALMTINKEEPLYGQLKSVKDNLDVAMNNIRESVHDLHDESVDLRQAVLDIMQEIKNNFNCHLDYDMSNAVNRKYKYAIIGIVKEAVSNIIKHSDSDNVDIIIREHPGMYQLIVHDYKNKISPSKGNRKSEFAQTGKNSGIGLQNMQDRVSALNGNITIDKNRGYKIFVTFPKNA